MNILIIDDEEINRRLIQSVLKDSGYDLFEAEDGKEGIKILKENSIDVVITDIFMPEMDGIEIVLELKRSFPKVKIIAVSAGLNSIDAATFLNTAKDFGADYVFPKPVDRNALLDTVEELSRA